MSSEPKHPPLKFDKEFRRQESIPADGIERALEILHSGRLHRYNTAPGEPGEVALLEQEFAAYIGVAYCAALASCGSAIHVALRCAGVSSGDKVLTNAFTLAPVPGAIYEAGAEPILVECTENYTIDLSDLEAKAGRGEARFLLLSHMRGHIADMDRLTDICRRHQIVLIEDCAHTMGARWGRQHTGTFGKIGCYSTQTYKHINSGEGGLLVSNDPDIMAQAILYSGSYMLYENHLARPEAEMFEKYKRAVPNFSLRMSNLQAAILRPQLRRLDERVAAWNERYAALESALRAAEVIQVPRRDPQEHFVGSSIQFTLLNAAAKQIEHFLNVCLTRGVEIKWFGWREPQGYTSSYESWQYIREPQTLAKTKVILDGLCDMRIPLTFTLEDCHTIGSIITTTAREILS